MFHAPNQFRIKFGPLKTDASYGNNGAFFIPWTSLRTFKSEPPLKVICSDGESWEHVSVSLPHRCPTWEEMAHVKFLFWDEDDCVVQYHPRSRDYVNNHRFCLHMWRPIGVDLPAPPPWMVGIPGLDPYQTKSLIDAGVITSNLADV